MSELPRGELITRRDLPCIVAGCLALQLRRGRCREHGGELCPVCPGERQRITDDADMCWRCAGVPY